MVGYISSTPSLSMAEATQEYDVIFAGGMLLPHTSIQNYSQSLTSPFQEEPPPAWLLAVLLQQTLCSKSWSWRLAHTRRTVHAV